MALVKRKSYYIDMVEMVKSEFEDYAEKSGVSQDEVGMHIRLDKEDDANLFVRLLLDSGFTSSAVLDDSGYSVTIRKSLKD